MKHSFFLFSCLIGLALPVAAQEQKVISSGGTYTENASGSVSWSIGEAVIETGDGTTHHATQGFHQSNIAVVGIEELAAFEITVYPNPTSDQVTVTTPHRVKLSVYDMGGRLVAIHELTDEVNPIDVSALSRGTYNLIFESTGLETRSAKLVVQ